MNIQKNNEVLVSIALATYNGGKYLAEQLESLLEQTHKNIEIIISDDKSTDSTESIIEEYAKKDTRIKYSINQNPGGFKKNFERAVSLCSGDVIFLCDQDDIWYKEKIEQHVNEYSDPNVSWVYNEVMLIDENRLVLGPLTTHIKGYYTEIKLLHRIGGRCILGCSTSYRSSHIKNIWPISNFAPSHDSWIQLHLHEYKSVHIKKILQDYRQHANNAYGVRTGNGIQKEEEFNNITKTINYTKDLLRDKNLGYSDKFKLGLILIAKIINLRKKKFTYKTKNEVASVKHRFDYLIIFRLKTTVRRIVSGWLNFNRPSTLPYITGDAFRNISDHIFDDISTVAAKEVATGDIIFVRSDLLRDFFLKIHKKISNPYILISHNSDQNIGDELLKYLDEKVIHFFAQNLTSTHPRCTPIPIGLQLRLYDKKNIGVRLIEKYKNTANKKLNMFYSFSQETNPKRSYLLSIIKENPHSIGAAKKLNKEEYYEKVASYCFNISPEGNGMDCHRTWESMYLNTIPIVERNASTVYWESIGLPILLVEDWSVLSKLGKETLTERCETLSERFSSPALYMPYWTDKIVAYKKVI